MQWQFYFVFPHPLLVPTVVGERRQCERRKENQRETFFKKRKST